MKKYIASLSLNYLLDYTNKDIIIKENNIKGLGQRPAIRSNAIIQIESEPA